MKSCCAYSPLACCNAPNSSAVGSDKCLLASWNQPVQECSSEREMRPCRNISQYPSASNKHFLWLVLITSVPIVMIKPWSHPPLSISEFISDGRPSHLCHELVHFDSLPSSSPRVPPMFSTPHTQAHHVTFPLLIVHVMRFGRSTPSLARHGSHARSSLWSSSSADLW